MKTTSQFDGYIRRLALCFALFCASKAALAGAGDDRGDLHSVIVSSDLTDDGRKVEHPTVEKPAYYIPRVIGQQVIGDVSVGDVPVEPNFVLHEAAKALAKGGYLVATKDTAAPSLILLFQWGYIKPSRNEDGSIATEKEGRKMTGLIAGQKAADLYPKFDSEVIDATYEDRYFVLIAAYDLKEYQEKKQKKLLWVTKMSTPMTKTTLENVIPMLIAQGRSLFGKESGHPRSDIVPEAKGGKVEAGQLKTIELLDHEEDSSVKARK